jgi:hypothetical protein
VTVSAEIQHILLLAGPVAMAISIIAVLISMRSARNTLLAVVLLSISASYTFVTRFLVPTPFGDAACRIPGRSFPHPLEFIAQCDGPIWWVAPIVMWTAVVLWVAWRDRA